MSDLGIPDGIRRPDEVEGNDGLTTSERQYVVDRFKERRRITPEMVRHYYEWRESERGRR